MARTFIGQLILRLQAQGLGEAKRVESAVGQIERAARRLSSMPWGANFQRQLDKLGVSARHMHDVRQSWNRLHDDMNRRGLSDAMKKSDIAAWRVATLGHFSAIRSDMATTERRAKQFSKNLQTALRPAYVMLGGYTGVYMAGIVGRNALTAASEQTRTKYRMELANVPPDEQEKMSEEAARLSNKYGSIDEQDILELNKTAWALMGGDGENARNLMEPLIRAFIADVTAVGVEKAGENLSSFLKAMDNLNVNEGEDRGVANIQAILDGWMKAKQVEGRDIEVGEILGFSRRAKVAKYALDDDFLTNYLPALGQDQGFDALGDSLSGAFQNLVTPSAGGVQGQYVKRQKAAGLRDANNRLIEMDLFTTNPYEWTIQVLKPLLEKNGTDTTNTGQVAEAIKKLMSNSKAAATLTGWIEAQEQIEKNIALYKNAVGTADAENARDKDPFAAWESVLASLRNLSAAVLPMESIAAGLNSLADTINRFKEAVKAGDPAVTNMALGAGGLAAAWGTWKITSGIWGLITAGAALNTAAVSLQAAAVSLGAGGGVDALDGGKSKKPSGFWGMLLTRAPWIAALLTAGSTADNPYVDASEEERAKMREDARIAAEAYNLQRYGRPAGEEDDARTLVNEEALNRRADEDRRGSLDSFIDGSGVYDRIIEEGLGGASTPAETAPGSSTDRPAVSVAPRAAEDASMRALRADPNGVEAALDDALAALAAKAARAGQDVQSSLSVKAKPDVDTSAIDNLIAKVRTAIGLIQSLGSSANAASASVDADLRRAYSDYGVAP